MSAIGLASSNPYTDDADVVADEARHAQDLGYATLWRSGDLPMVAAAVRATTIPVATGIISVSRVPAADVIALYADLEPGRFVVGIGGAHGPRPLQTISGYLDELDAAGIRAGVLAALGPNMLALARERAGGAYPYLVTPEYVAQARNQLGADRTLAVLQMVIPLTDRDDARRAASGPLDFLAWKPGGYRRNLLRQGFTETDIDQVSDRLLDGITAWGEPQRIAERVAEYHAAGADQVVLRIVGADDIAVWRAKLAATLLN
ncbi:TIGR03620 family F420-dependent LLM class oxidoreductase [Mycobacterium frederiksbergense]|uniref:TIGR03620 family F420-dependent LLM class oxidoreductase n=1 Tax=Mycolicibacterium frederiksbergense TaxID=117567 RepID=UPI0021F38A6F|nr:TIGR03620 family F420-dependent LLM class oxidoreductase [Mycolicibacterium frederiksbergense]MCV7046182.1 TIGR03620 family F420-dependent LLM class oxidoreductase [Mycolicibacterium frederiksbergense]